MSAPLYDVAVLALAAGRVSYSLTNDTIFRPLRELIWKVSAPETATDIEGRPWRMLWPVPGGEPLFTPNELRPIGWLGELASCPDCMSFYVAFLAITAYILYPIETVSFLSVFALWGMANLFARRF